MFIKTLTLKNFRNFDKLELSFNAPINVFTGNNGTGKTNILESIYLLGNIKSFRNVTDSHLIKWNKTNYYCSSSIENSSFKKISIGYSLENKISKKKLIIDNDVIKKYSDYYGKLLTVVIHPSDLNLIETSPEVRRKYFDSVISKIDNNYFELLNELKKIIYYRNILLKKMQQSASLKNNQIDVWDNLLAEKSNAVIIKRTEFVKYIKTSFRKFYKIISNEDIIPEIIYSSSFFNLTYSDILDMLKKNRQKDIKSGFTNYGPHRDDYKIKKNNDLFINSASQGQKRTAVISLKLSEIDLIENIFNINPVILIDDIFSELDENRRNNLITAINKGNQLFFTMVNSDILNSISVDTFEEYQVNNL